MKSGAFYGFLASELFASGFFFSGSARVTMAAF
jgi:hypothetical protein